MQTRIIDFCDQDRLRKKEKNKDEMPSIANECEPLCANARTYYTNSHTYLSEFFMICCHSVSRAMNGSYSKARYRKETSSRPPPTFAFGTKPPVVLSRIQPIGGARPPAPSFFSRGGLCHHTRHHWHSLCCDSLPLSPLSLSLSLFTEKCVS